jgi:hypothetical protein
MNQIEDFNNISVIKPDKLNGIFFSLENKLSNIQQRDRLAICPSTNYACLVGNDKLFGIIIVVDAITYDPVNYKILKTIKVGADTWEYEQSKESRVKVPDLSNHIDDLFEVPKGTTYFFFHWKFYTEVGKFLILIDDITSNLFRTVSHSNLCPNKRRTKTNINAAKRSKIDMDDDDEDIYLNDNLTDIS